MDSLQRFFKETGRVLGKRDVGEVVPNISASGEVHIKARVPFEVDIARILSDAKIDHAKINRIFIQGYVSVDAHDYLDFDKPLKLNGKSTITCPNGNMQIALSLHRDLDDIAYKEGSSVGKINVEGIAYQDIADSNSFNLIGIGGANLKLSTSGANRAAISNMGDAHEGEGAIEFLNIVTNNASAKNSIQKMLGLYPNTKEALAQNSGDNLGASFASEMKHATDMITHVVSSGEDYDANVSQLVFIPADAFGATVNFSANNKYTLINQGSHSSFTFPPFLEGQTATLKEFSADGAKSTEAHFSDNVVVTFIGESAAYIEENIVKKLMTVTKANPTASAVSSAATFSAVTNYSSSNYRRDATTLSPIGTDFAASSAQYPTDFTAPFNIDASEQGGEKLNIAAIVVPLAIGAVAAIGVGAYCIYKNRGLGEQRHRNAINEQVEDVLDEDVQSSDQDPRYEAIVQYSPAGSSSVAIGPPLSDIQSRKLMLLALARESSVDAPAEPIYATILPAQPSSKPEQPSAAAVSITISRGSSRGGDSRGSSVSYEETDF